MYANWQILSHNITNKTLFAIYLGHTVTVSAISVNPVALRMAKTLWRLAILSDIGSARTTAKTKFLSFLNQMVVLKNKYFFFLSVLTYQVA